LATATAEPHCIGVSPQPTACLTGERIATGDPSLIGIRVKHADTLDPAVRGGDERLGQPRALGQAVVVGPRVIGLDIVPSRRCGTAIDLDATLHVQPQPTLGLGADHGPPKWAARLRSFVACVPFRGNEWRGSVLDGCRWKRHLNRFRADLSGFLWSTSAR
jgi:hypothetical protein